MDKNKYISFYLPKTFADNLIVGKTYHAIRDKIIESQVNTQYDLSTMEMLDKHLYHLTFDANGKNENLLTLCYVTNPEEILRREADFCNEEINKIIERAKGNPFFHNPLLRLVG